MNNLYKIVYFEKESVLMHSREYGIIIRHHESKGEADWYWFAEIDGRLIDEMEDRRSQKKRYRISKDPCGFRLSESDATTLKTNIGLPDYFQKHFIVCGEYNDGYLRFDHVPHVLIKTKHLGITYIGSA